MGRLPAGAAVLIGSAAPEQSHRSAAGADGDVPPRHYEGPGCRNSQSTNSCYC